MVFYLQLSTTNCQGIQNKLVKNTAWPMGGLDDGKESAGIH